MRDYQSAITWFEDALKADPESPELITRTFLMDASVGRFDQAKALAESELKLDSTDAMAELVLLIERIKAGDKAGAVERANALPQEGVHRFVRPLARAWTHMAMSDVTGADEALQAFDKFNGFAPLKFYQLGLLYDFAGNAELAANNFKQALEASGQLNWRLTIRWPISTCVMAATTRRKRFIGASSRTMREASSRNRCLRAGPPEFRRH